jgi:hypothetical protein
MIERRQASMRAAKKFQKQQQLEIWHAPSQQACHQSQSAETDEVPKISPFLEFSN